MHDRVPLVDASFLASGVQTLIRAPGPSHLKVLSEVLDGQVARLGRKAVLLSTVHPPSVLQRRFGLERLPKGGLRVLDATSTGYRPEGPVSEGLVRLQTPLTLESVLASIERVLRARPAFDLLILDSLDLMSSGSPNDSIIEFFRILMARLAEKGITLVVLDSSSDASYGPGSRLASLFELYLDLAPGGGTR